ncbi:hypothetical protein AK812_SmicGene44665 [Symbiodinium microadriaticum]|uniref:Uncharacterized protein n=1 Tax=Symbiodinium microadriaticum TaxID=2951 RepID=A0A1Q9BY66_SYMMI|nr:hypothetical protein AK812_SmicGene44665 [Symbiodinium microadriaticum]
MILCLLRLCELDHSGKDTNDARLRSAGFDIGQDVMRKSDSSTGQIKAMIATDVTLLVGKDFIKVPATQFLAGDWKEYTAKPVAKAVPFLDSLPVNCLEFQMGMCKARVLNQMILDETMGASHYEGLKVFLKPSRDVRATIRFEKGALQIVASTHRVDVKPTGSTMNSSICCGTVDMQRQIFDIWLSSPVQQSPTQVLHPFWVLRTSANVAECNLELTPKNHGGRRLRMDGDSWHIPIAKNSKVINPGDSLILYKPVTAAKPEPLVPEKKRVTTKQPDSSVDEPSVWAITGGMLKKSLKWLVKTKTVEDKLFVEIDKWDRAFVPFVTGKPIQLKKEKEPHHLSIKAFQELLDLRKEACDRAYNRHIREAAATAGDKEPPHRNAREADVYVAGRTVEMECPEVVFGEETMPAQRIVTIWSVKDPVLWVELTPENLDYLALFMRRGLFEHQASNPPLRRRKKLRGEEVRPIAGSPKKKNRRGRKRKMPATEEPEPVQEAESPHTPPVLAGDSESDEDVVQSILNS